MSGNNQIKDKPDPKRSDVVIDITMLIMGAFAGIIINSLLENFSFSFECSYNKKYEEEEEGLLPPPYKP